uniref:PH domain-containing protein n=2 Tax=uncultured Flavonifractor sp. TaxID=1193534 RepID=UPI0026166591|nr:PH domain-containing protein [uncultured Flavonifractor sp.]
MTMGLFDKLGGSLSQGILGNMSEVSVEELTNEYGAYLMDDETIQLGFRLVRDVVLFTDKRIIDFDKQGATGQKMRVDSINLSSIIHVSAETSGFGMDDSEINLSYISSPYYKVSGGAAVAEKKFEFPKKYNIQPLYRQLQQIAYTNHENLNK